MTQPFADLSLPEKRRLLAELLREKARQKATFPVSHGQRGLWLLYQLNRDSAAYNVFFPARIRTPLDVPAFRRAVRKLLARHPSARTTFEEHNGELRQRVHEEAALDVEVIDASSWSEEALRRRLEEEAHRPFDLERGPLVRSYLFTRGPAEHVSLLTTHHIIGDFWSLVMIMEEMQVLYPAERDGAPAALPRLTHDYRDFVHWQADMLAGPEGERLGAYWEKRLAGVCGVLDLPTDRPRPPRFTQRGAAQPCRLDADLTRRVKELSAAEGVTLYAVLLAAFQTLLGRYTGQEDIVVGSPFAGRSRPEFERIVGYFSNLLPLRADLSGDPTFRDLLRQVGATVVEALEHQDYPFPLLVERLHLNRDPSRTPLVQASFTLERAHRPVGMGSWSFFLPASEVSLQLGGLRAEPYRIEHRTCQMDLEMVFEEGEGGIHGMLRYNTDLFDPDTIGRFLGHYRALLGAALANPGQRISQLPLLTPAEKRQLLHDWNDTRADYPRHLCLHQLFEQQAQKTPAAIALRCPERCVSYGELNGWANRLAHRLQREGVRPSTLVALCLERSPEMVAAILAILKAGGAYVPLDPTIPPERLRLVLEDTRAPLLLTQQHLGPRLAQAPTKVLTVDEDGGAGDLQESARPPVSGVQPGDLAYVIYTSGSTGRPKGVMIEHRAICNTIAWHCQELKVEPDDRVLLLVPYFFDASLSILFPALARGAQLVLPAPDEERDPARILERIQHDGVTILPILPRMLGLLLGEQLGQLRGQLRWVCCGGEAMPPDLPSRLFDLLDLPLYNLYGPTEAAIDTTCWPCRRGDRRPFVPIGRPIANVQVYVLDRHQQPVPVGVPGELYIGGAGLARGYLNAPELTAERFHPDPFRPGPGARLYRTGDRARWLPDGSIDLLGRLDDQVKLHGYRIEVGEVEAALAGHPQVQEAAVVVHTAAGGGQRLVAYVVPRGEGDSLSADLLRAALRDKLPGYMVPSTFVLLPALPHTPTGKVDRRALPAPLAERPATQPFVAPRTPLEEMLAGLWRDLLEVREVGALDNFFELGGSSMQAAVLIQRLQERLGQQIYTVAIFDSPTIAGLAEYLGRACPDAIAQLYGPESLLAAHQKTVSTPGHLLVPLQTEGSWPPLFLIHPPGGIVVCYQALAHRLGTGRPVYGIRARGLSGETDLPTRLEDMAAEYLALIRAAHPEGPYHLGGWSAGGLVAVEMAQQLLAEGGSVGLLALLDTTIPFNSANAAVAEDVDLSAREYGLDLTLEEIDRLGPEEQLPYLWQHVHKLGLIETDTPLPVVQQILEDLKRLFHAHVTLANQYAVRPYPGRITLFRPADSPILGQTPRDRNWGKLAADVDVHVVPGQHHTMVKEPQVQVLAEQLGRCLLQIEERGAPLQTRCLR